MNAMPFDVLDNIFNKKWLDGILEYTLNMLLDGGKFSLFPPASLLFWSGSCGGYLLVGRL